MTALVCLKQGITVHTKWESRIRSDARRSNAEQFERCFLAWTRAVFSPTGEDPVRQIAVDGKVMRRSFDRRKGTSPLLEGLDLAGALISLNALYAKKTLAKETVDRGADYLIALKRNNKFKGSEKAPVGRFPR